VSYLAEEIRGLNVKFDADFSEFKKNLKNADKDINSTQKQLKTLQESLKLEWDPKKFTQAQAQAQQALDATEEKALLLRNRLQEIEKAGVTDKNRDEYNYLMEQIDKTDLSAQKLHQQMKDLDEIRLKNLTKGLDDAVNKLDKAAQKTKGLSTAAAALAAGLVATGLKTVEQADEIATLATKYDMSAEAIQRFNYVALQTDTQAEDLYKAFVKVQGGVADLKTGVDSVSTKALNQLGLSFDQFSGKEEQFYAIIDTLSKLEDQEKMVSLANDIFGEKMATNLFPLIYAGTDAVNEYRQEFERMGALTDEQVQELAEYDNVLNELKTQYMNVGLQLGSGLLPVMKEFSTILTEDILPILRDVVDWFKSLDDGQQKALISLILLTAALSPVLKLFSSVGGAVSSVIQWLAKMDKATLTSYAKWGLLAAAVSSLFAVIANWEKMGTVERVVGLLGALSAAALAAAVAFGVFHSAWSIGVAVAGIVAGIATATAAINAAGKDIGADVSLNTGGYSSNSYTPNYEIPTIPSSSGSVTNNESIYVDNSNIVINIEKKDYMSEDDIIRAVNKGLKQLKQQRT
jgi:hypothetical protein